MTTFIRIALFFVCLFSTVQSVLAQKPVNMVVVLDLSDRLLNSGQSEKDRAAIMAAFSVFESAVRSQLFIKSKDMFSVVILPQRSSSVMIDTYEQKLRLDMNAMPLGERNNRFMEFKSNLSKHINSLYAEAGKGKNKKDYFGVDIWQFFNQSMNDYLQVGAVNKVLLLTDGYWDFESDKHTIRIANRYTSSNFMRSYTGISWKQNAIKKNVGFYAIQNEVIPCKVVVAGFHAKSADQIEVDKLKFFWQKWLFESGIRAHKFVSNMNADQFSTTIKSVLL